MDVGRLRHAAAAASAGAVRCARRRPPLPLPPALASAALLSTSAAPAAATPTPPAPRQRGTQAAGPSAYTAQLPPRERVEARAAELLGRARDGALAEADVLALVEEGIMLGQLRTLADFLAALGPIEDGFGGARPMLPPAALKRLLTAAGFQQAVDVGDAVATLAFTSPARRLDGTLVELYCNLVAGLRTPDHVRAITFAATVAELALPAVPPYLAALTRNHGQRAVWDAVLLMLDGGVGAHGSSGSGGGVAVIPPIGPELAQQTLEALVATGSPHIHLGFTLVMHAAAGVPPAPALLERFRASAATHGGDRWSMDFTALPWVPPPTPGEPGATHQQLQRDAQAAAVNAFVPGLLRLAKLSQAVAVVNAAIAAGMSLPLTSALLCRKLLSTTAVQLRRAHDSNRRVGSLASTGGAAPGATDDGSDGRGAGDTTTVVPNELNAGLLDALVPLLRHMADARALYSRLSAEATRQLLAYGRLPDALSLLNALMASPNTRTVLTAQWHLNPLLGALLRAGQDRHAAVVLERMLAVEPGAYPQMAPDTVTFNTFIGHAARAGDTAEVKRLMAVMRARGIKPDGATVATVANMRATALSRREGAADAAAAAAAAAQALVTAGSALETPIPATAEEVEALAAEVRADVEAAEDQRVMAATRDAERRMPAAASDGEALTAGGGEVMDARRRAALRVRVEAELDVTLARLQRSGGAPSSTDSGSARSPSSPSLRGSDAWLNHRAPAPGGAPAAPYNKVMQGYFRIGAHAKAAGVLTALGDAGIVPGPDTVRTLLIGVVLSGVQGRPDVRRAVPYAWGGARDDRDAYAEQNLSMRARTKQREGKPLGPAEAALLRSQTAPGVAGVLAQYRAALAAAYGGVTRDGGGAGTSSGDAATLAAASLLPGGALAGVPLTPAVLAAAPWLATRDGQLLAAHLCLFAPWDRDHAARLARVRALETAWRGAGMGGGGSGSGGSSDDDGAPVDVVGAAPPALAGGAVTNVNAGDAIVSASRAVADLFEPTELELDAEVMIMGGGGGGSRGSGGIAADGGVFAGEGTASGGLAAAAGDGASAGGALEPQPGSAAPPQSPSSPQPPPEDLLPRLPQLLNQLYECGVPPDRVSRAADTCVSWAVTRVPPQRILAFFLALYNCGVWGSLLGRSSAASAVIGTADVLDLRQAFIPSAALFAHAALSHLAVTHLGLLPPPAAAAAAAASVGGSGTTAAPLAEFELPQPGEGGAAAAAPVAATRELVLLTGSKAETLMRMEIGRLLAQDVTPPLLAREADRSLVVPRARLTTWLALERARLGLGGGAAAAAAKPAAAAGV